MVSAIDAAKIIHQANKAYCESIGDFSQKDWKEAHEHQKESVIKGVHFHLDNPNASPEDSHNSWLKEKSEKGWQYGEVKDEVAKTHPAFLPYNMLPEEQKVKDFIFLGIMSGLTPFIDPVER